MLDNSDFNPSTHENQHVTPSLNTQQVAAMVLEAAKYVAQAGLLSRRAARHTTGYRQREILVRLAGVLDSVVHPLCRTGRTLAPSHHPAEVEVLP